MRAIAVDDEKMALMRIERIIGEITGVTLTAAYQSSREALQNQRRDGADIAFLDVEMPDMDGLELAEALMENDPHIEVVFVTAHEHYALKAYQQNAIGYLLKPVQPEDLRQQVERIGRYRSIMERELPKTLHCCVFGSFYVFPGNNPAAVAGFRTEKTTELLALLVSRCGKPISRDAICELLWPDMSAERAVRNFHTTAYNLRHTFAEMGGDSVLLRTHDSYRINLEALQSDIEVFCRGAEDSADSEDWLALAEAAVAVYGGVYMADKDYVWLTEYQMMYERMYEQLCQRLSQEYERRGKPERAVNAALNWLRLCPLSEQACARLISLYDKSNEADKAVGIRKAFYARYVREMGEEPPNLIYG